MPEGQRHRVTLAFLDPDLELAYEREVGPARLRTLRQGLVASIFNWFVFGTIAAWMHVTNERKVLATCFGVVIPFMVIVLVATRWLRGGSVQQAVGALTTAVVGTVAIVLLDLTGLFERYALPVTLVLTLYSFMFNGLRFVPAAVAATTYILLAATMRATRSGPTITYVADYVMLVIGIATIVIVARRVEDAQREAFFQRRKSERLLLNILPASIAARLRDDHSTLADGFASATVMFCDLVGFTPHTATMTPDATVKLLNQLFSTFDDLAERRGLEKIKTIGDAYMVAGGVPEPRADHADAVVAMGLEMLEAVRPHGLELRIGVHTGPVVAGVIGKRKFAYDLWGDTVNTASRMESQGVPGRVQVSAETWTALGGRFDGEPRGEIDVKGKGPMSTWLLG